MRTGGSGGGATGGGSTGGGGASGGGIGERPIIMYPRHPCPSNSGTSAGSGTSGSGSGISPVVLGLLSDAGTAELAGGGPEDPVGDAVAGAFLVGAGTVALIDLAERRLPYSSDDPNSEIWLDRGNGKGQWRRYGPDGNADTDVDFGHDHGAGDPHGHDWGPSPEPGGHPTRSPGRPLRPGEPTKLP